MTKPQRPRRQRKGDRLLNIDAQKNEVACDHAIAPFDREARMLERKWGYDALPELVPPDMAAKYGRAVAYLNEAIMESDPDKCAAAALNCIKGLQAMDAAAQAAGHQPPQAIAHGEANGFRFRIVGDAADRVPEDGVPSFTLREVGLALKAQMGAVVADVKDHFPQAEVTKIKTREPVNWDLGGDQIPF